MPGPTPSTYEERAALRRAQLAKIAPPRSYWDTIKQTLSGIEDEGSQIYQGVRDRGAKAASQIREGNYPGAFGTIAEPVLSPFQRLTGMAMSAASGEKPAEAQMASDPRTARTQLGEMAGIPAGRIAQDWQTGNKPRAVGRGMFAAGLMGAGFGANKMFEGMGRGPELPEVLPPEPPAPPVASSPVGLLPEHTGPRFIAGDRGIVDAHASQLTDVAPIRPNFGEKATVLPQERNQVVTPPPYIRAQYSGTGEPAPLRNLRTSSGINPLASPENAAFEGLVPDRYKLDNIQPFHGDVVEQPKPAFYPKEDPNVVSKLPPVQMPGEQAGTILPAGTQSRLRKLGLGEDDIAKLDVQGANDFIKQNGPTKMSKAPVKSRLKTDPDFKDNNAVKDTLEQAKSGRIFSETRQADLEYLANKMNNPEAKRELEFRAKNMGGFKINPDMTVDEKPSNVTGSSDFENRRLTKEGWKYLTPEEIADAKATGQEPLPPAGFEGTPEEYLAQKRARLGNVEDPTQPRPPIGERLKGEQGSVNFKDIFDAAGEAKDKLKALVTKFAGSSSQSTPFMAHYADWVNNRKASIVEGMLKKREFQDLDTQGFAGIKNFQAGLRDGRLKDVADYFNDKYKQLTSSGVKVGFKENYLPQLWDNPKEQVLDASRRLGLTPKFSLESVLENYQAGIDLGLKPKFKTVSDLVGWYEKTANKAIADRSMFNFLHDNGLIQPKQSAPQHWKSLDPDHFPIQKFKSLKKEYTGVLTAPPEVAHVINNYLRDPSEMGGGVLHALADAASLSKNMVLSSGVPKTGLNAHGFNILARNVMSRGISGGIEAGRYLLNPKSAKDWLNENLKTAPAAMKDGLTLAVEDHPMDETGSTGLLKNNAIEDKLQGTKIGVGLDKMLAFHGKYFEDPLFKNVIPALKLKHFNEMKADFIKTGMDPRQAGQAAAHTTNSIYGGINWEAMGRSRTLQDLARATILAPDWFESNGRVGKGMAAALKDRKTPVGAAYANIAKNMIGAYVAANVVNAMMTDDHHLMFQNPPGHALDIQMGTSGDKIRYVRPFGTAADFARLPYETIASMVGDNPDMGQGWKILANRESIPLHVATHLVQGIDHYNRPTTGKDAYGRPIPVGKQLGNMLGEVSELGTPQYVANAIKYGTGQMNGEQALLGTLEAPVRYAAESKKTRRGSRSRLTRVR